MLALVLAGGKGSRMEVLTEGRAKPTLPFGGVFRLLDVVMSNVANSNIDDAWVVAQYGSSTLDRVLAHGRPWDLDRNRGGLRVIAPQEGLGEHEDGMARGNTDSLFRFRGLVKEFAPDIVLVLSSDHVYRLDYRQVIAQHLDKGAECTIVTTDFVDEESSNHTLVYTRGSKATAHAHQAVRVENKPDGGGEGAVATEVFVYSADVLLEVLEELHADLPEGESLSDFGEDLLPALVQRGKTYTFDLGGYWRDLGRPSAYLAAHRDLLRGDVDVFSDPAWPISTGRFMRPSAWIAEHARVTDSMVATGCRVEGEVHGSVLGQGVVVEAGAVVRDSVVMSDVVIRAGAQVGTSIVADNAVIGANARVGSMTVSGEGGRLRSEDVTLLGVEVRVDGGAVVAQGERLGPGARRRRARND